MELRQRTEAELRQRIEQLEKRQMQDDAVLNVINRYWNQLNEDVRILLQRFDAETADENESKSKYNKDYLFSYLSLNAYINLGIVQMKVRLPHLFLHSFPPGTKMSLMRNLLTECLCHSVLLLS